MSYKLIIRLVCAAILTGLLVVGCKPARQSVSPATLAPLPVAPTPSAIPSATLTITPVARPVLLPPCLGKVYPPVSDAPLELFREADVQPVQDELIQFGLSTTTRVAKPYNPAQINLVVTYTGPDGSQFALPVFWYKDFDPETSQACGQPGWKARLTPDQPGNWTAQAEIVNNDPSSGWRFYPAGSSVYWI